MDGETCSARARGNRLPCRRPRVPGATVCELHGGSAPQVQAKARERLQPAVDAAWVAISRLAESTDPQVRAGARAALDLELERRV